MEELTDEFIRRVISVAHTKSANICKQVMVMLFTGDHVGLKELLPEIFE